MRRQHGTASPPIPVQIWKIAAVSGTGAFMAMLDSTVANLALESVRADFDSTLSLVQWVATGYLLALAVSLPATGWLGNRYGYGRVWASALAAFVVGSILCALAPGPLTLIGARFLQGLAGGLMVPAGQAVLGSTANPKQLGRLMGTLGLVIALGPAIGPAMGGLLLELGSWRWLFWINVPIGIAALIASRGLVPAGSTDTERPLDRKGFALLAIGLPLLLYGATEIGAAGATAVTVLSVIAGAVLAALFVLNALHTSTPLIDLRLLKRKTFAAATATAGLTGANMYGGLLLLPLYLQLPLGQDTTETGVMLLVMGLGSALALPVSGMLTDRFSAGPVIMMGASLLVITSIPFLLPTAPSDALLGLILFSRGVGVALAQMPAMAAAYASVTSNEMGDATTLVNIVQRIGGAIGAVCMVIMLTQDSSDNFSAYTWAFATLAIISSLPLILTVFLWQRPRHFHRYAPESRADRATDDETW
ncbi:DHA2 family efflux MFS transporter permease subunit [Litchfieldella anticariensis]|uniref:DHA2 family efflux MFS transporter permease subunit n=1 Tax=Litchfieldella anticariensis TaxID=258591 RepID=UPI0003990E62|nr:DHA2 family efflux MFS transporter permease subunit [Halomonas anticariensis]